MREARLAFACLAALLLSGACGKGEGVNEQSAGAAGLAAGAAGSATGAGMEAAAGDASGGGNASGGVASVGSDLGSVQIDSIAVWKGDAKGAYTIIHDDICDYNSDSLFDIAEPELTARSLPSAFGAIVSRCQERELWPKLELLREHGHEVINHSWDHKDIVAEAGIAPLELEMDQATQLVDRNLAGQKTSFFIFPYDSFDDAAVEHLRKLGYLGARAGMKGVNDADFPDGLRVMFDVYGGENSIYFGQGDILKIYVDLAISQGGWSVREFHGIADTTFFPMPLEDYRAHLDYVKSKVDGGELWVDTPSAVLRYRFARQHCGVPGVSGHTLAFATPSADCMRYAAPLSVMITTSVDAPSVVARQAGERLKTHKIGAHRFVIDVDPSRGPAALGGGS